jgi:hypothetical protein
MTWSLCRVWAKSLVKYFGHWTVKDVSEKANFVGFETKFSLYKQHAFCSWPSISSLYCMLFCLATWTFFTHDNKPFSYEFSNSILIANQLKPVFC